jgi:uncharacterized protein (DUF1697 family)
MNADMKALKRAFEGAGFVDVATVQASGNVIFRARASATANLERRAEAAMEREPERAFSTFVRPMDELRALLEADPYAAFKLAPNAKRVITFLREPYAAKLKLPIESDGARILQVRGREVLCAYVPSPRGPVFMNLLEKTFGKDITTRTWETVKRVVSKAKI